MSQEKIATPVTLSSRSRGPMHRKLRILLSKVWQLGRALTGQRRHPLLSLSNSAYTRWIRKNTPHHQSANSIDQITDKGKDFSPLISIVVPLFNTDKQWVDKAVESVLAQVYSNWELNIINDGSDAPHVRSMLDQWAAKDPRIHIKHLEKNEGIAGATNHAIHISTGEFIAFMDSDDELHPTALYEVVKALAADSQIDVLFTDEDKLTMDGHRVKPVFKPGWDPRLFLTYNYINHLTVCRKSLVDEVGGFRSLYDWSQDYDLYLRVTEKARKIVHLPKILYHWRAIPGSSAARVDFREQALQKSVELLEETLRRRGIDGRVCEGLQPGTFKVKYN